MNHLLIARIHEGHEGMDDCADWAQSAPFPMAAEACTELGAESPKAGMTRADWLESGKTYLVAVIVSALAYVVLTVAMKLMGPQQ